MDKFHEKGNQSLQGSLEEDIIEAVLLQRAPFDKGKGLVYIYVRFLPKQACIYFFWDVTGPDVSTSNLRDDAKLSKGKYSSSR